MNSDYLYAKSDGHYTEALVGNPPNFLGWGKFNAVVLYRPGAFAITTLQAHSTNCGRSYDA